MKAVTPYLNFKGNAEAVFAFYEKAFRGEITTRMLYSDMPAEDTASMPPMSEEQKKKILHTELSVDGTLMLMGSDLPPGMENDLSVGTQMSLTIESSSVEEADRLFSALSQNGQVVMAMDKTFWNAYFGVVKDQFEVTWMINHQLESA